MKNYVELGSAPYDETGAQVGQEGYFEQVKKELREFKRMMEVIWPAVNERCWYQVKGFEHDFGKYYELVAVFENDGTESSEWAFMAEKKVPGEWDEKARVILGS